MVVKRLRRSCIHRKAVASKRILCYSRIWVALLFSRGCFPELVFRDRSLPKSGKIVVGLVLRHWSRTLPACLAEH